MAPIAMSLEDIFKGEALTKEEVRNLSFPDISFEKSAVLYKRARDRDRNSGAKSTYADAKDDPVAAYEEALRLKRLLDEIEACCNPSSPVNLFQLDDMLLRNKGVTPPAFRREHDVPVAVLSVIYNAELLLHGLYARIPLRHNPFLAHWVGAFQRIHDTLPGEEQRSLCKRLRIRLIQKILESLKNGAKDDPVPPAEVAMDSMGLLLSENQWELEDLRPYITMLQEEGIYDKDENSTNEEDGGDKELEGSWIVAQREPGATPSPIDSYSDLGLERIHFLPEVKDFDTSDLDAEAAIPVVEKDTIRENDRATSTSTTTTEASDEDNPNGNHDSAPHTTPLRHDMPPTKPPSPSDWHAHILSLLPTDPQEAISMLTHLPLELTHLDFMTHILRDSILETHNIDPIPVTLDFTQHILRILEAMGESPPASSLQVHHSSFIEPSHSPPLSSASDHSNNSSSSRIGGGEYDGPHGRDVQVRGVRLLLLFLRNLIRSNLIGVERLYFEVQEVCVRYCWIPEVREFRAWLEGGEEGVGEVSNGRETAGFAGGGLMGVWTGGAVGAGG